MKAGIPIFNLGRPDQDKVLEEIRQFLLESGVVGVKDKSNVLQSLRKFLEEGELI